MPNRTAVTAALALAATIATGTVAMATTLTGPITPVGTDAAVSVAGPETETEPTLTTPATQPAFDPEAVALLAFAAKMNAAGGVAVSGAAPGGSSAGGAAAPANLRGGIPSSPKAPMTAGHSPAPSPTPAPTAAPPTTNPAPPFDCGGSDDGLSEAVKHAREQYCHAEDDD
jgi:hypothetical protein